MKDDLLGMNPEWVSERMEDGHIQLLKDVDQDEGKLMVLMRKMGENVMAVSMSVYGGELASSIEQPGEAPETVLGGLAQSLSTDQRRLVLLLIQTSFCFGAGYAQEQAAEELAKKPQRKYERKHDRTKRD